MIERCRSPAIRGVALRARIVVVSRRVIRIRSPVVIRRMAGKALRRRSRVLTVRVTLSTCHRRVRAS
jgi:hypothetical protein